MYVLERFRGEELMEQPQIFDYSKQGLLKLIYAHLRMIKRACKGDTIMVTELGKDYQTVSVRTVKKLTKARS